MLEVKGQEQGKRLEFYTEGTATQEDLQTFKEALQEKTLQEEPLNIPVCFQKY